MKLNKNKYTIQEYDNRVFYIIYTLASKVKYVGGNIKYRHWGNIKYRHSYPVDSFSNPLQDIYFDVGESNNGDWIAEFYNFYRGRNILIMIGGNLVEYKILSYNPNYNFNFKFPSCWLFEDFEEDLDKAIILSHL